GRWHEPRRGAGHHRRDVHGRRRVRADLQPPHAAEPRDRMAADRQGGDHPGRRSGPTTRAHLTAAAPAVRGAPRPRSPTRSAPRDINPEKGKHHMKKHRHLTALVPVLLLVAAGCSSSGKGDATDTTSAAGVTAGGAATTAAGGAATTGG